MWVGFFFLIPSVGNERVVAACLGCRGFPAIESLVQKASLLLLPVGKLKLKERRPCRRLASHPNEPPNEDQKAYLLTEESSSRNPKAEDYDPQEEKAFGPNNETRTTRKTSKKQCLS